MEFCAASFTSSRKFLAFSLRPAGIGITRSNTVIDENRSTPDHSPGLRSPIKGSQLHPGTIIHFYYEKSSMRERARWGLGGDRPKWEVPHDVPAAYGGLVWSSWDASLRQGIWPGLLC
eukprot:1157785-Pelagomonas_calceolata.AAC.12